MGFSDRGYYRSEPSNAFLQEWTGVLTVIVANIAIWVANQPDIPDAGAGAVDAVMVIGHACARRSLPVVSEVRGRELEPVVRLARNLGKVRK